MNAKRKRRLEVVRGLLLGSGGLERVARVLWLCADLLKWPTCRRHVPMGGFCTRISQNAETEAGHPYKG